MKNNFDDILKKRLEETQFPVDDLHRQEMINLLNVNRRRKIGYFWWIGGYVVAIGIGVLAAFAPFAPISPEGDLKSSFAPKSPEGDLHSSASKSPNASFTPKSPEGDLKSSLAPKSPEGDLQSRAAVQQPGDLQSYSAPKSPEGDLHSSTPKSPDASFAPKSPEGDLKSSFAPKSPEGDLELSPPSSFAPISPMLRHFDKLSAPPADTQPRATAQQPGDLQSYSAPKSPEGDLQSSNPESIEISNTELNEDVKLNFIVASEGNSESNSAISDGNILVESFAKRNSKVTSPLDFLSFSEIIFERNIISDQIKPVFVKHHPLHLFAEAGISYVPASKPSYHAGWNLKAGGGLSYGLFPKTNLSLSAGYLMQKGGFEFEKTSTVQQSGFAARSNIHTLTPDKLHFVYSSIGVQHHVRRHMISLFGGAQYLYGAQGTIVILTEDQLTGDSQTSRYAWLSIDGMKRLLWNSELTYGYQVSSKIVLQIGGKYYFSSIEGIDPELEDRGFHWNGKFSSFHPTFTINYHLYGKK